MKPISFTITGTHPSYESDSREVGALIRSPPHFETNLLNDCSRFS